MSPSASVVTEVVSISTFTELFSMLAGSSWTDQDGFLKYPSWLPVTFEPVNATEVLSWVRAMTLPPDDVGAGDVGAALDGAATVAFGLSAAGSAHAEVPTASAMSTPAAASDPIRYR